MELTGTPGISLAFVNDGKVVYELNTGKSAPDKEVTKQTIFEGASLSKPLFAYFTMKLVEKEILNLDTPLHTYLPYADIAHDERYKKITARMVLSHQTGFPNWRTDSPGEDLFLNFEPGTGFEYSGEGYQYLALVLQQLTGTNPSGLQELFEKDVSGPLGMTRTRFIQNDAIMDNKALAFKKGSWEELNDFGSDEFGAAYGIHSSAGDFAKWLVALMQKKGLSGESFRELFSHQVALPEDNPNREFGITNVTLGFFTGQFPFGTLYGHGGNNDKRFTSLFIIIPESNWGMVLFTNSGFGEELGLGLLQFLTNPG